MQPALRCLTDINAPDTLFVRGWPDATLDGTGLDPRSSYVETFWLGLLGPSTTWLLRRLVAGLDRQPDGFSLSLAETARSLGLSDRGGRSSPFVRAISRTIKFQLARPDGPDVLAVRRRVPPLNGYQVSHLPSGLQDAHARWRAEQQRLPATDGARRRGRLLALSMIELGEDWEAAEHRLLQLRYDPALAHDAAGWAWDRHRAALSSAS